MEIHTSVRSTRIVSKWKQRPQCTGKELLMIYVTFGVAKQNCQGSGICKATPLKNVTANTYPSNCACKGAVAMVKVESTHTLVFFFMRASMCTLTVKQYFSDDAFLLEADANLQFSFSGKERSFVIAAGRYPVVRLEDYLIVRVNADG